MKFLLFLFFLVISLCSCRSLANRSEVSAEEPGDSKSFAIQVDDLANRAIAISSAPKISGLKAMMKLTYLHMQVLQKIPPSNFEDDVARLGLLGIQRKLEVAQTGSEGDGGLVLRVSKLGMLVGDDIQKTSLKRGLNFKLEMARILINSKVPQGVDVENAKNLREKLDNLEQLIQQLKD